MTDPYEYLSRLPFQALSRPPRRIPIAPDETGARAVLRLDGRLRAELHQQARLLVQSPVLLRQRAGERIAREHSHDYWEISFVIQGALQNRLTDGSEETLPAGAVMLIAPGAAHSLFAGADGTAMFNFMLDADYAEKLCWLHGLDGLTAYAREQRLERAAPECLYYAGETGRLWAIATEILREFFTPDERSDRMTDALALPLLTALEQLRGPRRHEDSVCEAAIRYVLNNPAEARLDAVARRFGYSPDHLSRLMKRQTGKSFQRLRQESVVRQAAHLLETTELSISDIAQRTGAGNLTRFYRLFASAFGCSPAAYRQRCRENGRK